MKQEKLDKTPARLDFTQSITGLILAIFIMGHILFEASILISKEMMYKVTIMFEGYYFFGETYPGIVSFLAGAIFVIFIVHAAIALRKFPDNYRQHKTMKKHALGMKHEDTSLWLIQLSTGFIMFFIGSVHLYMMMSEPSDIGPYASSHRVVHEMLAPLYILLLFSVITHAFIGLYRLALKWGFMEGKNTKVSRARYKVLMRIFIVVYILLGMASLAKYISIGLEHDFSDGVKYKSKTIKMENH
ncbi:fumarate reductase cytochrome b subunit [Sulfurimonas lithotrophica]|uniref:Fumarate reductase cytochrome b subunit n=1 Tax=Sulfurimonas lithotrophica TaxID=2590022 RepID=A0A5P8P1M0_9BACT|nr:fumarate reductase cytochrome b subunit [Sulfurimonas lithotrophica]QFR49555.1 fumarate reductase cytochrome b subunit [Sulfurimonas lithotrophica]